MLLSFRGHKAGIYLLKMDLSNNKDSVNMLNSKKNSNKFTRN